MPANPLVLQALRDHSVLRAPPGKPFILKSGKESMTYVDVRLASLNARALRTISKALFWAAHELLWNQGSGTSSFSHAAGVALGGCALATGVSSISLEFNEAKAAEGGPLYPGASVLDALYVRPEAKDHGTGKLVEGQFHPGADVVLFEDVVTSGGSSLKAIAALKDAGANVKAVVAVLDREEGGGEKISSEVPFRALCTMKELLSDGQ